MEMHFAAQPGERVEDGGGGGVCMSQIMLMTRPASVALRQALSLIRVKGEELLVELLMPCRCLALSP
jgi:hypothetical protein